MKRNLRRLSFEYAVAVASVLAVVGVRAALHPVLGDGAPLILFLIPVAVVGWFGGLGPGLVAVGLGGALGIWLFAPRATLLHPHLTTGEVLVRAIPFLIVGGSVAVMAALTERARQRVNETGHALAGSERRQRQIFDSATEFAILTTDLSGTITTWSAGAERIFGHAAAEAVGRPGSLIFTPEDRAAGRPEQEMTIARDTGRASDERWHVRRDGGRFYASGVLMPLRDPAGAITGYTKICRDITEQQQIRQELDEVRRRSETALLAGEVGTYEWDLTTDLLYGDANFHRIFAMAAPPEGRRDVAEYTALIHPDDLPRVAERIDRSIDTGEDYEAEYRVLSGGRERWVMARGRMARDGSGRVVRFAGVVIDVSERKQAAGRFREREDRYRTLFNSVDDGFCVIEMVFDAAGRPTDYLFLETNPTFERQTGIKDAVGRTMRQIIPDHEDSWFEIYGRVTTTGEPVRFSNYSRVLDRWFELYACRVGGEESREVAVIFADISARVKSDRDRQAQLEREQQLRVTAEQASRMKDEFLATISHELRTPLTSIVGWTHLLRADPADTAMLGEGLDVIGRNAEAQSKLIEDILDVSRITSGKLRLNVSQVDVREIAGAAAATVATSAKAKDLTLDVDAGDVPALAAGDPDRLQQVLWNLLVNAVKFTDKGGRVAMTLRHEASKIVVAVTDTGRGIDAAFLPHVFERFRQADMSSTRQHGGLGLGLSIVRHLVEAHGGTVAAASAGPGRGSTFTVTLPVASVQAGEADAPRTGGGDEANGGGCAPPLDGARVLVLDDEPDTRRVIQATLVRCGARVTVVSTVAEALVLLGEGHAFDAVLSDVGMPGENGHAFARRLRHLEAERGTRPVPAAALTAYTQPADRAAALDAGFDLYLAKPIKPAELLGAVTRLVDAGRQHPAGDAAAYA